MGVKSSSRAGILLRHLVKVLMESEYRLNVDFRICAISLFEVN